MTKKSNDQWNNCNPKIETRQCQLLGAYISFVVNEFRVVYLLTSKCPSRQEDNLNLIQSTKEQVGKFLKHIKDFNTFKFCGTNIIAPTW